MCIFSIYSFIYVTGVVGLGYVPDGANDLTLI